MGVKQNKYCGGLTFGQMKYNLITQALVSDRRQAVPAKCFGKQPGCDQVADVEFFFYWLINRTDSSRQCSV